MLEIARCDGAVAPRWDAFVRAHRRARAYHLMGWGRVIEQTFGYPTIYLLASRDGEPVGVLPLVLMKDIFFGGRLVSLPFLPYGGALAVDAEVEQALVTEAVAIAEGEGARHLELRETETRPLSLRPRRHKVTMRLELPHAADQLWGAFKSKLRSQIRKPQRDGLSARVGGLEDLDHFYSVFAFNMRDLGTPVYPKAFFRAILEEFPDSTRLCTAFCEGRAVAAALLVSFKGELEIPWASSLRPYRATSANMLLHWTALRYACESGHDRFDFGRSTPHGGTYRFKAQWGARPAPLCWYYWLADGRDLPTVSPDNPRYQPAIRVWRRLPLRLTTLLGPRIIKYVP